MLVRRVTARLLALAGVMLAATSILGQDPVAPRDNPELTRVVCLDLAPFCHLTLDDLAKPGAVWNPAPRGSNVFGGVAFQVAGVVQLEPQSPNTPGGGPQRVRGLPVGRKFTAVHLLHATVGRADDESLVGQVVIYYTDNPSADLPVLYGEHVRSAARAEGEQRDTVLDSNTRLVWPASGTNGAPRPAGPRIYKTTLLNPFPDKEVDSIDLVCAGPQAAWCVLALSVGGAGNDDDPAEEFDEISSAPLYFTARDAATGRPLEGLRVKIGISQGNVSSSLGSHLTDRDGKCTIKLPSETVTYIHMYMTKDGYVQKSFKWNRRTPADMRTTSSSSAGGLIPPTNYLYRADLAARLGGVIADPSGSPIADAKITVQNYTIINSPTRGEQLSMTGVEAVTDARGRWQLSCLPRNYSDFTLQVEHPSYATTVFVPDTRRSTSYPGVRVAMADLLATNAVMKVPRGVGFVGSVTDERGKPVVGARVLIGDSRFKTSSSARNPVNVRSDGQGRFRLPGLARGPVLLTVQAAGFAPDMRQLTVSPDAEPLIFRLVPGRLLKGRVVDPFGLPVADVRVMVEQWRAKQTLQWSCRTDGDGRFEWDSAPPDEAQIYFYKEGYLSQTMSVAATGQEQIVRLSERPVISGRVVDAETKKPVDQFTVIPGYYYGPGSYSWRDYRATEATAGMFTIPLEESGQQAVIKVLAPGYRVATSKPFDPTSGEQMIEIEMKRGGGLTGVVRQPGGAPAAGAQVALVTRNGYLQLAKGRFSSSGGRANTIARTDAAGRFTLVEDQEPLLVVAVHPSGYGEVDPDTLGKSSNIVLQAWGRIEGVFRIGAQPAPNVALILAHADPRVQQLQYSYEDYRVITDDEGRFTLEFVPPGERALNRLVPTGPFSQMWSQRTAVDVTPGQTARVVMGGTGRPVIGKAVPPNAATPIIWTNCQAYIYSRLPNPPGGFRTQAEWQAWQSSPEFRKAQRQQRQFAFNLASDGSFRIEDVPAGTYDLNLMVLEIEQRENYRSTRSVGSGNKQIIVPAMPGGRSDEPLDIGTVDVRLQQR